MELGQNVSLPVKDDVINIVRIIKCQRLDEIVFSSVDEDV